MKKKSPRYEFIEHTADTGLRVYGETLPGLFLNAAEGLIEILLDAEEISVQKKVDIKVEGSTLEDLLVSWLGEVLYQVQVKRVIPGKIRILAFNEKEIIARVEGEDYDPARHRLKTEIKAVTYHNLKVEKRDSIWQADVIFDI